MVASGIARGADVAARRRRDRAAFRHSIGPRRPTQPADRRRTAPSNRDPSPSGGTRRAITLSP